jgi:hypothetical protein
MSEDKFFDKLRDDAARLRYVADDMVWTRLTARIRERIRNQPSVALLLARWFRPITASFVMLAIAAALGLTWIERREASYGAEMIASNSLEITVDGDTYSLAE